MSEESEKPNTFGGKWNYLLVIVIVTIAAAAITLFILLIADALLYEKQTWQTSGTRHGLFLERINGTVAAIVFVITFIVVSAVYYLAVLNQETRDENILTEMQSNASEIGANAKTSRDTDSFVSTFNIGATKFEGKFYVQRIPRKGENLMIGVTFVSFKVNGCRENFYIEQKEKFIESGPESFSIVPVSENNVTRMLDGKYKYVYSDYKFFNGFLADDEIIKDLSSGKERYQEKLRIKLADQEFTIEYRREVSSDEQFAYEETSRLLKTLFIRAGKYHRRFEALKLIES